MILVVFTIVACTSQRDMVTIKYQPTRTSNRYFMEVPKGYVFKSYGASINTEFKLTYNDSSFIYITNFKNTPNYFNIKNLGNEVERHRFQDEALTLEINQLLDSTIQKPLPDTFELSGMQKNGLYWKDLKVKDVSIGYVNASKEKKKIFDKSLNTLKIK